MIDRLEAIEARLRAIAANIAKADIHGFGNAVANEADELAAIRSESQTREQCEGVTDEMVRSAFDAMDAEAKRLGYQGVEEDHRPDAERLVRTGLQAALAAAPEPQAEPDQVLAGDGKPCHGYGMRQDGTAVCFWPSCNCRGDEAEPADALGKAVTDARETFKQGPHKGCSMCADGDVAVNGLHRDRYECPNFPRPDFPKAEPADGGEVERIAAAVAKLSAVVGFDLADTARAAALKIRSQAARIAELEGEIERLRNGWMQAERQGRDFFQQSCNNLKRAEQAEAQLAAVGRAMLPGGRESDGDSDGRG